LFQQGNIPVIYLQKIPAVKLDNPGVLKLIPGMMNSIDLQNKNSTNSVYISAIVMFILRKYKK